MPECGSQCILCDLPIRFDTYLGCTHGCKYCFVQRKSNLSVKPWEDAKKALEFATGKRTGETKWADWNIPLHWGGMSDPFQPVERREKRSLEALKVFADTGYPVVISTKGKLCIEEPYISLIARGNIVMQVSALCEKYDKLEPGAPTFAERLLMIKKLSRAAKRVIVRAQPYIHDIKADMLRNIKAFAEAGAFGVVFEGMKFVRKKTGLVRVGGDWCLPYELLRSDFLALRDECHRQGLAFYSGENRLRWMGDSLTCCGVEGLPGFIPNRFNVCHLVNGDIREATAGQKAPGSATPYQTVFQTAGFYQNVIKGNSFEKVTEWVMQNRGKYITDIFALDKNTHGKYKGVGDYGKSKKLEAAQYPFKE